MSVYFAQTKIDATKVKIGWSSNVEQRQTTLSVGVPGGVMILATMEGGKETEEYLHEKFADLRVSGEWFEFAEPIRQFIIDIKNGKQGLIPFRDEAAYMTRETAEYARDAVELAKQMADALLRAEFRGPGDTVDAAMFRVQQKTGLPSAMIHRLRYRALKDIPAGTYLHIKAVYEQRIALADTKNSKVLVAGSKSDRPS